MHLPDVTLRGGTATSAARLLPGALVWLLCVLALVGYDAGLGPVVRYSLFLGLGVMLPGTLLWRALRGNVDGFAADVAFGTGLGFAITVLAYLPARAIGLPLLVLAFPIGTVAAFCTPWLRRHWRSQGAPMPLWWSWSVAAVCALGVAVVIRVGFMIEPAAFPDAAFQYVDLPYNLALAGELKHHLPGQIPYVTGEALHYHWFTHAQLASASWQSGLELDLLLRRMLPITATVGTVFGVAVLAGQLARRPWAGPVAGCLLVLVSNLDVYGWNGTGSVTHNGFATGALIYSPTHAFAILLAVPAIWLVVSLLRRSKGGPRRRGWELGAWSGPGGSWVLLGIQLAALSGSKPTTVPMIAAASGLVFAVQLLFRRVDRTAFLIGAGAVALTVVAQLVLFGTDTVGTEIAPLRTFRALAPRLGFANESNGLLPMLVCALTLTVAWVAVGAGMIGFAWARAWRDPAAIFLIGYLVAALGAASLLYQDGLSQQYFVRAAVPIAAAGSAWGLAILLSGPLRDSGQQVPARRLTLGVAGFGVGVALAWAIGGLTPTRPGGSDLAVTWKSGWPWLAVVVLAVLVGALATALLRMSPARWRLHGAPARGLGTGVAVAMLLGAASIGTPVMLADAVADPPCVAGPNRPGCIHPRRMVPEDGELAARYIREHSGPNEVLATNSHCVPAYKAKECDARNFWLSAYAERRVLVEGWAYTPTAYRNGENAAGSFWGPYWDQPLLAANDAVFRSPTAANIAELRDRHGVRWLVNDENVSPIPAELERLVPKRFVSGAVAVFEIPG